MNLGPVLSSYRYYNKIGVRALAKDIGIDKSTLNRIENGIACESDTLAKILLWLLTN